MRHRRGLYVTWTAIAFVGLSASALAHAPASSAAFDTVFRCWDSSTSPRCAVGVIRNGEVAFSKGYGMADLASGVKLNPRSISGVASLSKHHTAYAIARLVRSGRISVDADVRQYLPELPDDGTPIRVRDLLFHTSGLRDYASMISLAGLTVFHAGDHARWNESADSAYRAEIDYLAELGVSIDIALVPVATGARCEATRSIRQGALYAIAKLRPRATVPMHVRCAQQLAGVYREFAEIAARTGATVLAPRRVGEEFSYVRPRLVRVEP